LLGALIQGLAVAYKNMRTGLFCFRDCDRYVTSAADHGAEQCYECEILEVAELSDSLMPKASHERLIEAGSHRYRGPRVWTVRMACRHVVHKR
jgi:hypothetical protein